MDDAEIINAFQFVADLGKAHLQDLQALRDARLQVEQSFHQWEQHLGEYLLARYGIRLAAFHYFPSLKRCVFVYRLRMSQDVPSGGCPGIMLRYAVVNKSGCGSFEDELEGPGVRDVIAEAALARPSVIGLWSEMTAKQAFEMAGQIAKARGEELR